jgi:hypothetical protein
MTRLSNRELAGVTGGESSSTTTLPFCELSSTTSDYRDCLGQVQQATSAQSPSTGSWWNPFGTDTNAGPRATALLQNMRETCGLPQ